MKIIRQYLWALLKGANPRKQAMLRKRAVARRICGGLALRCAVFALALAFGTVAQAKDPSIVVNRGTDAIEVYFSLPAEMLVSVFGLPPTRLQSADGTVDFDSLRLGTWDKGDAAFEKVDASIGGAPAAFEAMSLMVHPNSSMLPMRDPIEGMIAIAVCSVPTPAVPPTLDDLRAYVGYIAYTDTPGGTITLDLPETGRDPFTITVNDYTNFELRKATEITINDGGSISIETGAAHRQTPWLALVMAVVIGLTATGLLFGRWVLVARRALAQSS